MYCSIYSDIFTCKLLQQVMGSFFLGFSFLIPKETLLLSLKAFSILFSTIKQHLKDNYKGINLQD